MYGGTTTKGHDAPDVCWPREEWFTKEREMHRAGQPAFNGRMQKAHQCSVILCSQSMNGTAKKAEVQQEKTASLILQEPGGVKC